MEELIKQTHTFFHDFPIALGITLFFSVAERFFLLVAEWNQWGRVVRIEQR
jgi:hypothetical protein